tara:strand:+ start:218 stop:439 length:222 start_codon:yes stop_codon:yes gene_type:complete
MSNNKKMTEEEINDLVKKTMDEVMASITPALEAKYDKYNEKKAKDKAEKVEAEAELDAADKAEDEESDEPEVQ